MASRLKLAVLASDNSSDLVLGHLLRGQAVHHGLHGLFVFGLRRLEVKQIDMFLHNKSHFQSMLADLA